MRRFLYVVLVCMLPLKLAAHDIASIRYLLKEGQAYAQTSGPSITHNTPFAIASIGKTFTAVAILKQVAKRTLTLDQTAASLLPADIVRGLGGMKGITLRHLLTMTSGLPDYYSDDYLDDVSEDSTLQTPHTALTYAYGQRVLFKAGRDFDYSNTNYVLLGIILERVTKQPYARGLAQSIFKPTGMTKSFVFGSKRLPPDFPDGHERGQHVRSHYESQGFGDGGVISTAKDLAQFYKALFVDKTLLPDELLNELLTDPLSENYGMGIEVGKLYGHSGGDLGFSSDVRINPSTGAIAIEFIAEGDANIGWTEKALSTR